MDYSCFQMSDFEPTREELDQLELVESYLVVLALEELMYLQHCYLELHYELSAIESEVGAMHYVEDLDAE